jgi:hypothetical protein
MVPEPEPKPLWEREDRGTVTIVRFATRLILGLEMVHSLRDGLIALVEHEQRRRLVLDFERVELCDSLFISTIFQLVKRLRDGGGRLAILSLGPGTGEIFAALPSFYPESLRFSFDAADALTWCAGDTP